MANEMEAAIYGAIVGGVIGVLAATIGALLQHHLSTRNRKFIELTLGEVVICDQNGNIGVRLLALKIENFWSCHISENDFLRKFVISIPVKFSLSENRVSTRDMFDNRKPWSYNDYILAKGFKYEIDPREQLVYVDPFSLRAGECRSIYWTLLEPLTEEKLNSITVLWGLKYGSENVVFRHAPTYLK